MLLDARAGSLLGHIINRQGVGVDPAKTEAIEQQPTPTSVKDIRAFLGLASYNRRYIPGFSTVAAPLTNLTCQGGDLVWDDACEGAFQTLKAALVTAPILTYPTREGHFVLSTDASDVGIGAVLEQEQEEGGRVANKVIAYASKTLSDSQHHYCMTNKELLAVVMAVELFKYYLTGRHFTVVTDHASLTWLRNFREPEGMVARWISRLQPFDFAIVHRPGKHHSHADGLSRRTSRPCKRETCPECRPLQQAVTTDNERARCFTPVFPYQRHFDGYVEMSEEDAALFWSVDTPTDPVSGEENTDQTLESTEATLAEGFCLETTTLPEQARATNVLTVHCNMRKTIPAETQETKPAAQHAQATNTVVVDEIRGEEIAIPILRQLTTGTQTGSGDSSLEAETLNLEETVSEDTSSNTPIETTSSGPSQPKDKRVGRKSRRKDNPEIVMKDARTEPDLCTVLPFPQATWRSTHRLRAVTSAEDVDPRVLEVLDLPTLNLAAAQEEDPDIQFVKELLRDHDVRPPWDTVREESAEVKILWTQFHQLKIQEHVLYGRRKETAANPQWQVVAPKPLRSQIFKACHHHAIAAHQGVVRTAALIKRWFYWPKMQKDVEAWCKRCTACGRCKTTVRGHSELQQPKHGAFNERVSVDLIGPLQRTERGNEYIVVMQDHFTKWIEGTAVPTKEAMIVADVLVHEWIYKHGTPLNLHSDRGTEFTAAVHRTYSTAYNP